MFAHRNYIRNMIIERVMKLLRFTKLPGFQENKELSSVMSCMIEGLFFCPGFTDDDCIAVMTCLQDVL
jgi:hypothetical protein